MFLRSNLGEINDSQRAAWCKSPEIFDEAEQRYTTLSLFAEDREVPAEALGSVQVKLKEMKLRRSRAFGDCWLACLLWQQLGLDMIGRAVTNRTNPQVQSLRAAEGPLDLRQALVW
jgi:hypothetical protein